VTSVVVPSVTEPGLFGKLPSHGDFVSRGLSTALCDGLDRMLQAALGSALREGATRESLEQRAGAFSLHLRAGTVATTGFFGCVVPSCDRVGRFFPLCVGLEVPAARPTTIGRDPLVWPSLALTVQLCQTIFDRQSAGSDAEAILSALPPATGWASLQARDTPFEATHDLTLPPVSPTTVQFAFGGPEAGMRSTDAALCGQMPLLAEALGAFVSTSSGFDLFFATRSLLSWSPLAALFDQRWAHWGWAHQQRPPAEDDETLIPEHDDDAHQPLDVGSTKD